MFFTLFIKNWLQDQVSPDLLPRFSLLKTPNKDFWPTVKNDQDKYSASISLLKDAQFCAWNIKTAPTSIAKQIATLRNLEWKSFLSTTSPTTNLSNKNYKE
jgi:hypothetical protein